MTKGCPQVLPEYVGGMLPKVACLSNVLFAKLMLENVSETFGVTRIGFQEIIHPDPSFERWTIVMGKTKMIPLGTVHSSPKEMHIDFIQFFQ